MIELRWLALTQEQRPFVLQYRHKEPSDYTGGVQWSEWKEVPFVLEEQIFAPNNGRYMATIVRTLDESKKIYD